MRCPYIFGHVPCFDEGEQLFDKGLESEMLKKISTHAEQPPSTEEDNVKDNVIECFSKSQ